MAYYTVHKDKWDKGLRQKLERAGVEIVNVSRGAERKDWDDVLYPGRSIETDYVGFGTTDDDKAKQVFGNQIPYYDATNQVVGNSGCLGCGLLIPVILGIYLSYQILVI